MRLWYLIIYRNWISIMEKKTSYQQLNFTILRILRGEEALHILATVDLDPMKLIKHSVILKQKVQIIKRPEYNINIELVMRHGQHLQMLLPIEILKLFEQ